MDDYCGNLDPFMEPVGEHRPFLQNAVVMIRGRKFKANRWFCGWKDNCYEKHCYVFIDIHPEGTPQAAFAAKPSQVSTAVTDGRITIIKYGHEHFFDD